MIKLLHFSFSPICAYLHIGVAPTAGWPHRQNPGQLPQSALDGMAASGCLEPDCAMPWRASFCLLPPSLCCMVGLCVSMAHLLCGVEGRSVGIFPDMALQKEGLHICLTPSSHTVLAGYDLI